MPLRNNLEISDTNFQYVCIYNQNPGGLFKYSGGFRASYIANGLVPKIPAQLRQLAHMNV